MKYKAKILTVDDEVPVCKSIFNTLKKEGYKVDIALSGGEALEKIEKNKYAVIITDLMMPGLNGMELLEQVKKKSTNITVIMITGYPSIKTAIKSIKLGAFDYLSKPFTPKELRSLVSRALERRFVYEEMASKMGVEEESLVTINIPPDIYFIPENSWAKVEKNGNVRVGAHHIFIKTIKNIKSISFPSLDEVRYQGEECLKINDYQDGSHKLWMPVSGKIIDKNEKIKKDYSKLLSNPYKEGWLLLVEPECLEDDLKNLSKQTTG